MVVKQHSPSAGFTLLELLISAAIIVVLSAMVLANTGGGTAQYSVENASAQVALELRKAEALANASTQFQGKLPTGYGVHFEVGKNPVLFVELDTDYLYTPGEAYETLALPLGVAVQSLSGGQGLDIFFLPPKLDAYINAQHTAGASAAVTLAYIQKPSISRLVSITSNGNITVTK